MSNVMDLVRLRQCYLKLLVDTLKKNVQKASTLMLDDLAMTHYGMKVEESCLDKSRGVASYTKAITEARLQIERYTSMKKLYPMIAESMHVDNSELVTTAQNNNVAEKRTVRLDDDNVEPAKRPKCMKENEVIVIDSSDSEDKDEQEKDQETTKESNNPKLFDDDDDASKGQDNNNENIAPIGEILISVQTTPISIDSNKVLQ